MGIDISNNMYMRITICIRYSYMQSKLNSVEGGIAEIVLEFDNLQGYSYGCLYFKSSPPPQRCIRASSVSVLIGLDNGLPIIYSSISSKGTNCSKIAFGIARFLSRNRTSSLKLHLQITVEVLYIVRNDLQFWLWYLLCILSRKIEIRYFRYRTQPINVML